MPRTNEERRAVTLRSLTWLITLELFDDFDEFQVEDQNGVRRNRLP